MDCPICQSGSTSRLYEAVPDLEHHTSQSASFNQCSVCKVLFQEPAPSAAALQAMYPADYRASHATGLYGRLKWLQALLLARRLRSFVPTGDPLVAELGCGAGQLLLAFHRLGFRRLIGVDWSINRDVATNVPTISFVAHDIMTYIPPQPVDVLIVNNVIEHLADPLRFLTAYRTYLTERGVILVLTPNATSLCHRAFRRYWSGLHSPWHVHVFTRQALAILAERAGLRVRQLAVDEDPGGWAISVQNWWRSRRQSRQGGSGFSPLAALALPCSLPVALVARASQCGASLLAVLEPRESA
jgi:SAM-dependent methyltransferase